MCVWVWLYLCWHYCGFSVYWSVCVCVCTCAWFSLSLQMSALQVLQLVFINFQLNWFVCNNLGRGTHTERQWKWKKLATLQLYQCGKPTKCVVARFAVQQQINVKIVASFDFADCFWYLSRCCCCCCTYAWMHVLKSNRFNHKIWLASSQQTAEGELPQCVPMYLHMLLLLALTSFTSITILSPQSMAQHAFRMNNQNPLDQDLFS